jgi:hypothetical protein
MNEYKRFEIDFSEAKSISTPSSQIDFKPMDPSKLNLIWGFTAPKQSEKMSGPCAIGTILHYHGIGWNHIPKDRQGRPLNDPFIEAIVRWSEMPDLLGGSMDTSPPMVLSALRKADLHASWYAGNSVVDTLQIIQLELLQGRPVMVLINHGTVGHPLLLEWQVVYKLVENTIHTKQSSNGKGDQSWSLLQFKDLLKMDQPELSCSIVTAAKD